MATQRRRIGLRARVISSFGLLALLLSLGLSGVSYFLLQASTLERREDAAKQQAFLNARFLRTAILDDLGDVANADLPPDQKGAAAIEEDELTHRQIDGISVLWYGEDRYTASGLTLDGAEIDPQDIFAPTNGDPAAGGDPPAPTEPASDEATTTSAANAAAAAPGGYDPGWAQYYEITSLADVESMFNTLAITLLVAVGLTTTIGLLVGRWVSRRVLAPLSDVNAAVQALADMSFDTKLPATRDPDLAPLVSTFNHTVASLHERIERDGRFASDVSHELRSPLTTLTNSVAVLERYNEDLPEPARRAIALLSEEFERFQQLVGDLLEISRFDAGAQHLDRSPLVVGEFVRHAVRMTCPEDDMPISIDPDLEEAVIMADKRRLVQVLSNLAVNASKYAGGVTEVTVTRARGGVEIAVVDAGPGVPLEDRIRVFDRFARGISAGRRGSTTGTGLGLSLVAEHMRLHGGNVRVEDRLDGAAGARFVVYLPATPVSIYDTEADFEAAGIGADL